MNLTSFFKNLQKSTVPGEKRYDHRLHAADLFIAEFKQGGKIFFDKGFGCDLSLNGAQFKTLVPFQKGETIKIVFRFSPQCGGIKPLEMAARVVRSHRNLKTYYRQIGCHFLPGQEKQKESLKQALQFLSAPETIQQSDKLAPCRRSRTRVKAKDSFMLEFSKGGKKVLHKGYGCDLSPLGASFMTLASLRKGETIGAVLHFSPEFEGAKNMELSAKVVWVEHSRKSPYALAACRFQDPKGMSRWMIKQFLEWVKTRNKG